MDEKIIKVGLTGGIGAGKSVVAKVFTSLGIAVMDADTMAKDLVESDAMLRQEIIAAFGEDSYVNGKYNRAYIANIVFANPEKRTLLNAIIHPRVIAAGKSWFEKQEGSYAIKEAALLIESGSYKDLDFCIHVEAPIPLRIQRVMERDGSDENSVKARIGAQMSDEDRRAFCKFIVYNDEHHSIIEQVMQIHSQLVNHGAS